MQRNPKKVAAEVASAFALVIVGTWAALAVSLVTVVLFRALIWALKGAW